MTSPSDKPVPNIPPDETEEERVEEYIAVDCRNQFGVQQLVSGTKLLITNLPGEMTQLEAYILAAWLFCRGRDLKVDREVEFGDIVNAVEAIIWEEQNANP